MDLSQRFESSPWPTQESQRIVFIIDANNDFEQELLEQWIAHYAPPDAQSEQVLVALGDDRKGINSGFLAAALSLSDNAIVAPVRVAWLPPQAAIDSGPRIRDLLFGDPRRPSPKRARAILSEEPQRLHFITGKPDTLINLRTRFARQQNVDDGTNVEIFAEFAARQAALVLDIGERRLQGSRYKVPRYVAESLRASPRYNEEVDKIAKETGKTRSDLMKEATTYMEEMISIPRTFWLDFYARFNSFCLGLGYEDEIIYNPEDVEQMRRVVRDHPSLLLWTHKTYLDGMVVPKVLYDNDFPMPHMFGGANLSFAGLGFLLRRSGAIFIRRSFQDNALYKLTLRHYIGYLMEKRFPMNWAFEGTRSRMGKLMPPRYGLLKYVLEACHATQASNIHIIPVSISYDLIRDVEEYATEQTGRGKGAESLRWFIGYIRSLARPMGKVYMDIGEPVVLPQAPEPSDSLALSKIAFEIAVEANKVTPITFPALVTMSLLGAAPKALTEKEVIDDLQALLGWAESRNLRISRDFERAYAEQMYGLLDIMIGEGIVSRYDQGPETVYGIAMEQHPVASYYRNTIIHFFVNKAIIELALLKASEHRGEGELEVFWHEVDGLRDLFKFEFFYAPTEEFHQEIRAELERYDPHWENLLGEGTAGFMQLLQGMTPLVAHTALLTYAEAYSVVADLLAAMEEKDNLEEAECISNALKFGRQSYLQRRISSESSIGKLLFKNGFKMIVHRQLDRGGEGKGEQRAALSLELRDVLRRIEVIRAIVVASRGAL